MSRRLLTDEQEEFFIHNQKGLMRQAAADLMNETFGLNLTALQVKELRRRLHPEVGKTILTYKNPTQFKKGERPHNYQPIGTEAVKWDGYLWVKVADPDVWKQKHILMWEKAYGPRQPGEKITFLNNDRFDIRLDNLAKVSDSVNSYMTSMHLRNSDPELARTGMNLAMLMEAVYRKKKKGVSK